LRTGLRGLIGLGIFSGLVPVEKIQKKLKNQNNMCPKIRHDTFNGKLGGGGGGG
jgi:hypothetical protein